jgi:hypothetical protein
MSLLFNIPINYSCYLGLRRPFQRKAIGTSISLKNELDSALCAALYALL